MKQTKIICTLGPSTDSPEMIYRLAQAGMNVARINFSHGSSESNVEIIKKVKKVREEHNISIGVLLDTKGPEIRLGVFENDSESYVIGETITLCKEEIIGNHDRVSIMCPELFDDVKPGNYILINDGKMVLKIMDNNGSELKCRVEVNGKISSRKGCNVPGVKLSMPFISSKDAKDIKTACDENVDFIAASFVRRADDVLAIRKIITENGCPGIRIIAKIENDEGYHNLQDIIEVADGIMVARGDLGVEIETALVPMYQKEMIRQTNLAGKQVVTATHMLDSMTENPRCTRAEASDVYNAVLDGSDAVMLSSETATGLYPVEATQTMASICELAEKNIDHYAFLNRLKEEKNHSIEKAIGEAIAEASLTLPIAAIVAFTQSGQTARTISHYRPACPIYALTFSKDVQGKLESCWGVNSLYSACQNTMSNDAELACSVAKSYGFKPGELIIVAAGYPVGEGATNMMKIIKIR